MRIAEVPVGTALRDTEGLSFLVADHHSPDYPGTVLVSEKVIGMMAFDAPDENEEKERKRCGSNDFPSSDLCLWLNREDGFLQKISVELKESILESQIPYAGMTQETGSFTAKVFIPSIGELGLDVPDHNPEGHELKLFADFRNRYAFPVQDMVDQRPPKMGILDANDTWPYWLRSAHPTHGSVLYVSHCHSPYVFCEAFRDYIGVRVMLAVSDDLDVELDEEGGKIGCLDQ